MRPAPFEYLAPATLDDAVGALAGEGGDAKVLAGGQSLIPMLALRLARPTLLVDINRIAGLDALRESSGTLEVGALVRRAEEHLTSVARALERLEDGTYGVCEACGRAIPAERLEARPTATRCVACATSAGATARR